MNPDGRQRVAVAGSPESVEPFGPGTMSWDLMGDRRFALMYASAFLLQTMHPEIGAAVSKQSTFRVDPGGRAERSLAAVQTWIYGGAEAFVETRRLVAMHAKIRGTDDTGRRYDALDPDAWAWVPLSSFHSSVVGHEYFYDAPLSKAEQEQLYADLVRACRLLHVPERLIPPTVADYWVYFHDVVDRVLEGHAMAHAFLDIWKKFPPPESLPSAARFLWPAVTSVADGAFRIAAIGLLPQRARDKLGLPWSRADERRLRAFGRAVAETVPRLPERLRYMPIAYCAREAARAKERLDAALRERPRAG
jgi:uncharacterized protein (DUF2236 family)